MVVALVQFNIGGASVDDTAFLQVTTTNVFADDETVRFVASRSVVLKAELFVSLSMRAIAARADAAGKSMANPPSSSTTMRAKM